MRVFALGGYGTFGRLVAKNLCASDLVTEVVVAGRNIDAAKEFAHELGGKAEAAKVDVLNEPEIRSVARGSDLLVNTTGPDHRTAFPAARAAIEIGAHYCDLSADCESTKRLLEHDSAARAAGTIILPGIGYCPGETNLLLKHAASQLDKVEDLRLLFVYNLVGTIFYFAAGDPGETASEMRRTGRVYASLETVMNWGGGRVYVFRENQLMDVDPSMNQENIDFPGEGNLVFFPIGGPEAVTIPRFLGNMGSVSIMLSVDPPEVRELYLDIAGRMRSAQVNSGEAVIMFLEGVSAALKGQEAKPHWRIPRISLRARATGLRDGRRVRYSCWPAWKWAGASHALTVAALKILRGEISERGVLAPEACLDPMDFFEEAARLTAKDSTEKELLTESFEELG